MVLKGLRRGSLVLLTLLNPYLASSQSTQGTPFGTSGFIDSYFSRNFARPSTELNRFRAFDGSENQFALSLAEIVFSERAEPVGFRLDADFGPANDLVESGITGTAANVKQVYASVVAPLGRGLTIDAGKFVTPLGFEVIESKDNWNYSRSLLFSWAIPFFHVGVRASYPLTQTFSLTCLAVNGSNVIKDNNGSASFGAGAALSPDKATAIVVGWIGGPEQPAGLVAGNRNVVDVVISRVLSTSFDAALNADYGEERTLKGLPVWKGVAGYLRYRNGNWGLAARGEWFSDPDGYATGTGIGQELKEVTLTSEHRPLSALLLRLEFRRDWSDKRVFDKGSSTGVALYQDTLLLGTVVMF